MALYEDAILALVEEIGYYVTEKLSYYVFVSPQNRKIIIGPMRQIPNTEQELRELAFLLDIPEEEREAFLPE